MKKAMALALIGLIVGTGYAQALQRANLLNRGLNRPLSAEAKFKRENPTGTNEFGRTWKDQCAYEKFMKEHPNGKSEFGKTFDEQYQHEAEFDIKSFLGLVFGETGAECLTPRASFCRAWRSWEALWRDRSDT